MRRLLAVVFAGATLLPNAFAAARDGQHDFDFNIGTWKTHIRRLKNPLTGSTAWFEADGIVTVRKIWGGKANLEEIEAEMPSGHFEGLTLRLYDAQSHQWNLSWANAQSGVLSPPNYGEFRNGRGEFYDQETFDGKTIIVRQIYSDITPDSYHFEQAFSADHGRTYEPNFVADLTRIAARPVEETVSAENRNRDFDFNFGHWKTHVSRLQAPLTGSKKWVEYDGTSDIAPVWNGRASLFELNVEGPAGKIQGVGLRLYNPETHEWSLNWANSHTNALGVPTIGTFHDGHGEFEDQEAYEGRQIFIRNEFSDVTPQSSKFQQAFSDDGGKTWETNWVMTFRKE